MTKLISGRVKKIHSANVSASRYEFIRLSETEPDLGVPAANGYILTANVDGSRHWVAITPNDATNAQTSNVALNANTANIALNSNTANVALNANTANVALNSNTANVALNANTANVAQTANVANTVLSISNFTTSNLTEGTNLYYTNTRVYANVSPLLAVKANVTDLTTSNVIEGNQLYYTNARVNAFITPTLTTANVIESAANLYFTNARAVGALIGQDVNLNNLVVQGNLRVQGDIVTLNTATVNIEDKNILLGNGATILSDVDGAGLTVNVSGAELVYRQNGDRWEINKSLYTNVDIYSRKIYVDEVYANVWILDAVHSANLNGHILNCLGLVTQAKSFKPFNHFNCAQAGLSGTLTILALATSRQVSRTIRDMGHQAA